MSTSPISPEDIRAAAEVHHELGPEYSDAVVAAFLDKVDKEVAARVDARLAEASRSRLTRWGRRRTLVTGVAMGACAGALITGIAMAHVDQSGSGTGGQSAPSQLKFVPPGGVRTIVLPDGRKVAISFSKHGPNLPLPAAPTK
jgi:hypothetical protein